MSKFNVPIIGANRSGNNWNTIEQQLVKLKQEVNDLDIREGYTKEEIDDMMAEKADASDVEEALDEKVDKVEGKELSSNDYTDAEKEMLAEHDTEIGELQEGLDNKVDKEAGKGLSSNDFTDGYKTQISDNTNRITDAEGEIESINTHISGTDETIAEILLDIGTDVITTIGTSIKNAIVNLKNMIDDLTSALDEKQDILTPDNGIDITADKKIKVKIDGTTIKVNDQGNLWADTNGSGQHGYEPDQNHGLRLYDDMMGVKVDGVSIDFNENGALKCFGGGGSGDGYLDGGCADSIYQVGDTVDGGYANSF